MKLHTLLHNYLPLFLLKVKIQKFTSIENDNRKVKQGSLFICIKGYTVDGHDFAESAEKNGAVAVLAKESCH